jgi:hypothetical protein
MRSFFASSVLLARGVPVSQRSWTDSVISTGVRCLPGAGFRMMGDCFRNSSLVVDCLFRAPERIVGLGKGGRMTLLAMEGVGKLAREWTRDRADLDQVIQSALDVFESHPDGMPERALIQVLVDNGASPSVASASADELISGGVARKDWVTGVLTHVH